MVYSGINLENVKLINRSSILKLQYDHGSLSRKDIALKLGLTPAAVTQICSELLEKEIIKETGEVSDEARVGRKKILLEINYEYSTVISVCIEELETSISLCSLNGKKISQIKIPTANTIEPKEFLMEISSVINAFKKKAGKAGNNRVLGIGVSVPGIVRRDDGVSVQAYRIWDESVNVAEVLTKATKLPVVLENNVRAFTEAELLFGSGRSKKNLLFVKWGPGVGAAFSENNVRLVELGHVIVEENGLECRCGKRGCLETRVSTHAVTDRVRETLSKETMPLVWEWCGGEPERIRAGNVTDWISLEDDGLKKVLEPVIRELSRTVVNAITLLSPGTVAIYGNMFSEKSIAERFISVCREYNSALEEDMIVISPLAEDFDYIGSAAIAINEYFINMS